MIAYIFVDKCYPIEMAPKSISEIVLTIFLHIVHTFAVFEFNECFMQLIDYCSHLTTIDPVIDFISNLWEWNI